MSKPDTWMPLYIGDYMADTMHLTTEQHGAYLLLLLTAWNRGGYLPSDETQLALICRADKKAWGRIRSVVLKFFEVDGDKLVQGRLLSEYEKAVKVNAKQKANGSLGGRPPKTQKKPMGFDSDNPNHNPNETPSPSPIQHHKPLASSVPSSPTSTTAGRVCARLKQAGVSAVNPSNPKLLALLDAGLGEDELADIAGEPGAKGKGFAWILAAAEGRRREAATIGNLPNARASPYRTRMDQQAETLAGLTGGLVSPKPKESNNDRSIEPEYRALPSAAVG